MINEYFTNRVTFLSSVCATPNLFVDNDLTVNKNIYALGGNSNNWNSSYSTYKSNSSTYTTYDFLGDSYLPLSGGRIDGPAFIKGNVTIFGDLSSNGTQTFANTVFTTTSSLSVYHVGGNGPALIVSQNGTGDIASFYDIDQNLEILHVGGQNSLNPNVGIKTSTPNKDFTVNGEISSNNTIWSSGGNSNNWNSVYSSTKATSGNWNSVYSSVVPVSGNWDSVYSSTKATSGNWDSVYSSVVPVSGNWNSVYSSTKATSGNWDSVYSSVVPVSGNWNSVYSSTKSTSGDWNSVYSTYKTNSADYVKYNYLGNNYLPLSGGSISGDLTITGNISTLGTNTQIDTLVFVTSAVSVTNTGTGPALTVKQTGSNDIVTFYDDSNTALIIKDGGNVGIGTASPAQTLTVVGNQLLSSTIATPNATFSAINVGTGNAAVFYAQGTAPAVRITQTGTGNALLVEDSATPDSTPFVIKSDGSVGIGTTNPITPLDVRGNIFSSTAILSQGTITTPKLETYTGGDCLEYVYSQGITKQYIGSFNALYTSASQSNTIDLAASTYCPFFALGQYANKIVINVIIKLQNTTTGANQMGSYTGTYVINATPNAQGFIGYLANGSNAALTLTTDYAPAWAVTMGAAPTLQATAATTTANGSLNLIVRSHTGAGSYYTHLAFFVTSNVMYY